VAKSQTSYATNASNNLVNQTQGFAGPGSQLYGGFQSSLGTAQGNQGNELSGAMGDISNLESLSTTGGYNPSQLSGLNSQTAGMTATGGYNPSQLNQIQGEYTNLAQTGGFTPQQAQQFVQQATEGTQTTYGALEQQAKQAEIATGGLGTGGALSQMARQLGQAQSQNTLNAEVDLNQLQTSNKLAGLGGESSLDTNVAGNRLAAQGQQLGLASNVAGNTLQGTEAAGQQLSQLYNTTTGQITQLGNQMLQSLGLDFNTQAEAIQALTALSKNPGLFQTALSDISSLGGAAAGAAGSLGVKV
jgi:hypothetical protein